jgi:hypothetical protein
MKRNKLLFAVILFGYAFLYIATSYAAKCEDDCEKTSNTYQELVQTRPYVYSVRRCTNQAVSDTLCVYVRDTTGINWSLFADTACMVATQQGLPRQKIYVIKAGSLIHDTVAFKICP